MSVELELDAWLNTDIINTGPAMKWCLVGQVFPQ